MSHQLSPLAPIPGTGDRQALRAANREGAHESDEGNVICVTQQVYQLFLSCNSPIIHSILFMFGSCLYWFCVGQEGGTCVLTLVIFHNTTVCGVKKKTLARTKHYLYERTSYNPSLLHPRSAEGGGEQKQRAQRKGQNAHHQRSYRIFAHHTVVSGRGQSPGCSLPCVSVRWGRSPPTYFLALLFLRHTMLE